MENSIFTFHYCWSFSLFCWIWIANFYLWRWSSFWKSSQLNIPCRVQFVSLVFPLSSWAKFRAAASIAISSSYFQSICSVYCLPRDPPCPSTYSCSRFVFLASGTTADLGSQILFEQRARSFFQGAQRQICYFRLWFLPANRSSPPAVSWVSFRFSSPALAPVSTRVCFGAVSAGFPSAAGLSFRPTRHSVAPAFCAPVVGSSPPEVFRLSHVGILARSSLIFLWLRVLALLRLVRLPLSWFAACASSLCSVAESARLPRKCPRCTPSLLLRSRQRRQKVVHCFISHLPIFDPKLSVSCADCCRVKPVLFLSYRIKKT
jgi:hypothetical protein